MPTITVHRQDLNRLLGVELDAETLRRELSYVKGELKGADEELGTWKIELNDTNRPDLWCPEGIARQLRGVREGRGREYACFLRRPAPALPPVLQVAPEMAGIRPYGGAFLVRGLKVTAPALDAIISTQEKLCENFGHRRRTLSIGYYRSQLVAWPVTYGSVEPGGRKFVPLGMEGPLTPAEVLQQHPKGIEYAHLLASCSRYPLLTDAKGRVLSFPPVINSADVGAVAVGESDLLVEATGTELDPLLLVLSILAANLEDRGAEILPVTVKYPYDTPRGREITIPCPFHRTLRVALGEFHRCLGEPVTAEEVARYLLRYGCTSTRRGDILEVECPPWRDDYMHAVDVVEDFAISRGYASFEPVMPRVFTVGQFSPRTRAGDRARDLAVGLGFEEIIASVLTDPGALTEKLRIERAPPVVIANPVSDTYSALRDRLLPSLLAVERESVKAIYPHRIFEVGEVAVADPAGNHGSRTELHLGMLMSQPVTGEEESEDRPSFSEMQARTVLLGYYLGKAWTFRAAESPFLLPGRSAVIRDGEREVGWIGELHPEVLARWEVKHPAVACEVKLD